MARYAEYLCTFKAEAYDTCEDCKQPIPEGGYIYWIPDGGYSPDGTYRCLSCMDRLFGEAPGAHGQVGQSEADAKRASDSSPAMKRV